MPSEKHVVIVDGYSAGNLLPPVFKARGFSVIHVQSTPTIWPVLAPTFRPDDYARNFAYEGELGALAEQLSSFAPQAVLAGTETGVELADRLAERLALPGNGTRLSEARRNKYLMIEAARKHGLLVAEQLKSDDPEEIIAWMKDHGLSKVVLKPLKSAGTDNVAVCRGADEIRLAAQRILGKHNQLGILNQEVLCQEFLEGREYAVDAVSYEGRPHFTALWKYHKLPLNGGNFVYDRDELISCTDTVGRELCEYATAVLEALEISVGPSHAEIMLTPRGPALVEIGARLNGVTTPALHERCVGYGQLDLTVDSFIDGESFRRKTQSPYELREHAFSVSLISRREGVVRAVPGESRVRALPSFNELRLRAKPGYQLKKTTDYFTSPGFVMLVHPDPAMLEADLRALRALEENGLYELEP